MGRAGLINSGGASGKNDFGDAAVTAVINKRAGGMGLISGRKAFQRPMAEGAKLLNVIQDVYLRSGDHGRVGTAVVASWSGGSVAGRSGVDGLATQPAATSRVQPDMSHPSSSDVVLERALIRMRGLPIHYDLRPYQRVARAHRRRYVWAISPTPG